MNGLTLNFYVVTRLHLVTPPRLFTEVYLDRSFALEMALGHVERCLGSGFALDNSHMYVKVMDTRGRCHFEMSSDPDVQAQIVEYADEEYINNKEWLKGEMELESEKAERKSSVVQRWRKLTRVLSENKGK